MSKEFEYPAVDLYSIGKEMMRASQFEEKYYAMEADRDYWRELYNKSLSESIEHSKVMMGNFLELALSKADTAE